jgi:hypothetical protein
MNRKITIDNMTFAIVSGEVLANEQQSSITAIPTSGRTLKKVTREPPKTPRLTVVADETNKAKLRDLAAQPPRSVDIKYADPDERAILSTRGSIDFRDAPERDRAIIIVFPEGEWNSLV